MSDWFKGTTDSGSEIRIPHNPYHPMDRNFRAEVYRNGDRLKVIHVDRYRDGGSTSIQTDAGEIYIPNRIGQRENAPTFNGEPFREWTKWREGAASDLAAENKALRSALTELVEAQVAVRLHLSHRVGATRLHEAIAVASSLLSTPNLEKGEK